MWQIWLIISGICFIVEMATVGFFIFWFGIGAILSMFVSLVCPENIFLQSVVFIVSSVILLFLTKPLVDKFTKKDKKLETNAFSIIGKKGIVIQDINSTYGIGQIKVSGEVWSAKTLNNTIIEKGTEIEIIKIEGVKAVVKPIKIEIIK